MDADILKHWEDTVNNEKGMPTLEKLLEFLQKRINYTTRINQKVNESSLLQTYLANNDHMRSEELIAMYNNATFKCDICSKEHRTFACPIY